MITVSSVIDHVGIINQDLASCKNIFLPLGFACGASSSMDTGISGEKAATNIHFMFDNTYVECIQSVEGDYLREYLHSSSALHTVVLSSTDIRRSHKLLESGNYKVSPIMEASRPADHGINKGTAVFGWIKVLTEIVPFTLMGIAEHKTKELIFQEGRYRHPNTAYAVERIIVHYGTSKSAAVAAERFSNLCNVLRPAADRDHLIAKTDFLSTQELATVYKITQDAERSNYAGMVFLVKDMENVRTRLSDMHVLWHEENGIVIADFIKEINLFLAFRGEINNP